MQPLEADIQHLLEDHGIRISQQAREAASQPGKQGRPDRAENESGGNRPRAEGARRDVRPRYTRLEVVVHTLRPGPEALPLREAERTDFRAVVRPVDHVLEISVPTPEIAALQVRKPLPAARQRGFPV